MHDIIDKIRSQEDILLALSGIYLDPEVLDRLGRSKGRKGGGNDQDEEEEEEMYRDNSSDMEVALLSMERIAQLKDNYMLSSDRFQKKLRTDLSSRVGGVGPVSDSQAVERYNSVVSHMNSVITEAFSKQISSRHNYDNYDNNSINVTSSDQKWLKVDLERIKNGIIDEFEIARSKYDSQLAEGKVSSFNLLQERFQKRKNRNSDSKQGGGEGDDDVVESVVEEVVRSFLSDPVVVPVDKDPIDRRQRKVVDGRDDNLDRDRVGRIRNTFIEKEKILVKYYYSWSLMLHTLSIYLSYQA